MAQRNSGYDRRPNNFYPTPPWVTMALWPSLPRIPERIWEPAAGNGKMVEVLRTWGCEVVASDIEERPNAIQGDFLKMERPEGVEGIITNPPYGDLAQAFVEHALRLMAPVGGYVAMLANSDWEHAQGRTHLFRDCPQFCKRIVLLKRIVWFVEDNGKPKASPSQNHVWNFWCFQHSGPPTVEYAK